MVLCFDELCVFMVDEKSYCYIYSNLKKNVYICAFLYILMSFCVCNSLKLLSKKPESSRC